MSPDSMLWHTVLTASVMGIRHKRRLIEGVQFHPESVLTPDGLGMIERWVGMVGVSR